MSLHRPSRAGALLGAALFALSLPAAAQPSGPDTSKPGEEQPAPGAEARPTDPCAAAPGTQQAEGDLTGKLADCKGVLTPPATADTSIQAPAPDPDPNTTPVIPPGALPQQPAN
ncbi:hypothetical protein GCM10011390_18710 [Aureimonas endophytica]|uniref:Uncharacterized protein n=1 Tax=Aureimonas endophytica TaxID=2027858 RepID=A0A917E3I4_9HYPH|nr:hypothetical protein [Aureimonas endophytica]GGE00176.1 hypothetical protein GCM10011390_18710 [Aureimonas endophytica]